MTDIVIRRLEPGDDRSSFASGNAELDLFFKQYAGQNQFRLHIGITYVAVQGARILGFATVSSGSIEIDDLPRTEVRRLPRYPIPVLRLARLAVDGTAQGLGVGKLLLRTVLQIALSQRDSTGCLGVVVDAKPEAVDFYTRYGFVPLDVIEGQLGTRPAPTPMFLALGSVPVGRG
ncbi:MAG: GNAT family N-acetyltransferase [Pseudomonadota bacterium]